MKLGRVPSRLDRRSLKLRDYFPVGQVSAPPLARDYSTRENGSWGLYRNGEISDCVPASFAHLIQTWSSMSGCEVEPTEDNVISAYKAISGWDGINPDLDVGCSMLDAYRYWRSIGIGGHKITSYVSVDPTNRLELEASVNLFGGITVGADMPAILRDQVASGSRAPWDVAPANQWTPEYRPGSWGGHAMACVAYTRTYATLITWGRVQVVTRNWLHTYCSEAWAAISSEWVTQTKLAPNGFDLESLDRSLTALAA